MHWVWPIQVLLTAMVLGPALGVLGWHAARRRRQVLAQWAGTRATSGSAALSPTRRRWRDAALAGTWVLILIALARPQGGMVSSTADFGGTVVLAIDGSASMRAADVSPSRLALATQWAQDLAAQLPGYRLGLITFAGEAQVLCPPTEDHAILRDLLADVPTALPAREGSELGPALELGRKVLERVGGGVLLVVTDGEHHDRDLGAALNGQRQGALDLVTVTVGGTIPVPIPGPRVGEVVTDPRDGHTALTAARPEAMRALARSADGLAVDAGPSGVGMAAAVRFIQARLALRAAPTVSARREEFFQWPVGLALLLLVLRLATPERARTRSLPATARSLSTVLALVLLPCLAARGEDDPDASAQLAARREASLLAPGHDRPRCLYNLALALHESGQTAEARGTYAQALALPGAAAAVRARCLNNLGALAIAEARDRAARDAGAALATLCRAQAALHEAQRLDPRLEIAGRNLRDADVLADLLQARLAAAGPEAAVRSPGSAAPPPTVAGAGQAPAQPRAALTAAGALPTPRLASGRGAPVEDGGALERLCGEAGSAREFLQILTRGRRPERRPAALPW